MISVQAMQIISSENYQVKIHIIQEQKMLQMASEVIEMQDVKLYFPPLFILMFTLCHAMNMKKIICFFSTCS